MIDLLHDAARAARRHSSRPSWLALRPSARQRWMQSSLRPTIGRHRRHFTGTTNPKPIPSPLAAVLFVTLALTLTRAAYAGSAACVHMLIDAGAKPGITNKRDNSQPLHLAARYGKTAALVALADDGACI